MHAIFTDTRKTTQKKRQYCPTQHNTHKFYNRLKVVSLSLFSSFDFSLLLALTILPLYYRAAIAALLQTCKVACDEFTPFVEAVYAQLNKDPNASVRKEDKSFFSLADGVVQARSLDATRARTTRAHTHVHVHVHVHVASKGRIEI